MQKENDLKKSNKTMLKIKNREERKIEWDKNKSENSDSADFYRFNSFRGKKNDLWNARFANDRWSDYYNKDTKKKGFFIK